MTQQMENDQFDTLQLEVFALAKKLVDNILVECPINKKSSNINKQINSKR